MTGVSPESRPDTTAIRARAEAATQGDWQQGDAAEPYENTVEVYSGPLSDTSSDIATFATEPDAAHIAGMDPATTIQLLDALDTAEGEVERLRESSLWWKENRGSWAKGYEALVASIKALADKWDATTERVTGVAADHWRGRDFAEGVSLRTETLVDDLRAVLDGTDHTERSEHTPAAYYEDVRDRADETPQEKPRRYLADVERCWHCSAQRGEVHHPECPRADRGGKPT